MNLSPARKVLKLKKRISRRIESSESDRSLASSSKSKNSFLVEIEHNRDIDWKVRKDIEEKFKKSNVNAQYVFPRIGEGDKSNLPKIKFDRRHVSQFDATLPVGSAALMGTAVEGKSVELGTSRYMKMPSLAKGVNGEKRNAFQSVTPYPYLKDVRKTGAGSQRNTPSPAPNWRSTPYDKKRML